MTPLGSLGIWLLLVTLAATQIAYPTKEDALVVNLIDTIKFQFNSAFKSPRLIIWCERRRSSSDNGALANGE